MMVSKASMMTLAQLQPGDRFRIQRLKATGAVGQRLLDLGFIRNACGEVVREALLKDPIEIILNGTRISLRKEEAELIEVVRHS